MSAPPAPAPHTLQRGPSDAPAETWGLVVIEGEFDLGELPADRVSRAKACRMPLAGGPSARPWPAALAALCACRPGIYGGPPALIHVWPAEAMAQRRCVRRWLLEPREQPGYLLIVASPRALPLDVEARLAAAFVVGRVWFDAEMVSAIWPGRRSEACLDRWARRVARSGDAGTMPPAVTLSTGRMVERDRLRTRLVPEMEDVLDAPGVVLDRLDAPHSDALADALVDRPPHLWIHAGYGDHHAERVRRGSLKCAGSGDLFDPHRVARRRPAGGIALLAGCYVGGTTRTAPALMAPAAATRHPGWAPIVHDLLRLRTETHISGLVTALLGGDAGFGAVVSWYDMLFTSCLGLDRDLLSLDPYATFVRRLLRGDRLGAAFGALARMEQLLRGDLFATGEGPGLPPGPWADAFTGWVDYRNVRVFGDPWVCLGARRSGR